MSAARQPTRRELLTHAARLTGAGVLASMTTPAAALGALSPSAAGSPPSSALSLPAPPLQDADYWAFADWCQAGLEPLWSAARGTYGYDARVNAALLITHSLAALEGHDGPTRQDERARLLTARLLQSPPYLPGGPVSTYGPGQRHTPGFVLSLTDPSSDQHVAIDPEVTEGLVFAWRAREALGLSPSVVAAIEQLVAAIATGRFYRYPSVRLNQFNWCGEMYAYAAEVAGRTDLLRNDYRLQLLRFLRGCCKEVAPWKIANLSASYSFHRNPFTPVGAVENVESTEYANIVMGSIARYGAAREAGMAPLPAAELHAASVDRARPARLLDPQRLPQLGHRRAPGSLEHRPLLGVLLRRVARHRGCARGVRAPEMGRWAKYMFDRALSTYTRLALQQGPETRIPGSPVFSPTAEFEVGHWLFATRFQSQAARAAHAGLGHAPAGKPPPLYAFDPSIGRLAITTPKYNTAVMAVSNGAFPYGGIELARLFDGDQRVAAGVAPYGEAGFGVTVTEGERVVLSSQTPYRKAPKQPPVVLTRSPRGAIEAGTPYPEHPYAGAFEEVRCVGEMEEGDVQRAHHPHLHRGSHPHRVGDRACRRPPPASGHRALPQLGRGAQIAAILKTGAKAPIGSEPLPLRGIARFEIRCGEGQSGYSLKLRGAPGGALAYVTSAPAQSSNARPGPQLVVELAQGDSWRELGVAAELIPGAR